MITKNFNDMTKVTNTLPKTINDFMADKDLSISLKMIRFVSQKNTMNPEITDFVGYGASFFVVLSFVMKDIKRLRIVNLVGCVLFVLYGAFNNYLWPIIIPNAILCLSLIHI